MSTIDEGLKEIQSDVTNSLNSVREAQNRGLDVTAVKIPVFKLENWLRFVVEARNDIAKRAGER
jgi:hypothetical protein